MVETMSSSSQVPAPEYPLKGIPDDSYSSSPDDFSKLLTKMFHMACDRQPTIERYNANPDDLYQELEERSPKNSDWSAPSGNNVMLSCLESSYRNLFVKQYSWAIPCRESIQIIKDFVGADTVLEIGSGSGLWAYLLQASGVNIIATDIENEHRRPAYRYLPIEMIDYHEAIPKYQTNILMLCWGDVNPLRQFKGNKYIYIGEADGCTSGYPLDDNYDDSDDSDNNNNQPVVQWNLTKVFPIKHWSGIKDKLYLFERKTEESK